MTSHSWDMFKVKQTTFYQKIAERLHENLGIRREDVVISLLEVAPEDWSLGNGEAQYA